MEITPDMMGVGYCVIGAVGFVGYVLWKIYSEEEVDPDSIFAAVLVAMLWIAALVGYILFQIMRGLIWGIRRLPGSARNKRIRAGGRS